MTSQHAVSLLYSFPHQHAVPLLHSFLPLCSSSSQSHKELMKMSVAHPRLHSMQFHYYTAFLSLCNPSYQSHKKLLNNECRPPMTSQHAVPSLHTFYFLCNASSQPHTELLRLSAYGVGSLDCRREGSCIAMGLYAVKSWVGDTHF